MKNLLVKGPLHPLIYEVMSGDGIEGAVHSNLWKIATTSTCWYNTVKIQQ